MWITIILSWTKFLVAKRYKNCKVVTSNTQEHNNGVKWCMKYTTTTQYKSRPTVPLIITEDYLARHGPSIRWWPWSSARNNNAWQDCGPMAVKCSVGIPRRECEDQDTFRMSAKHCIEVIQTILQQNRLGNIWEAARASSSNAVWSRTHRNRHRNLDSRCFSAVDLR